MPKVMLTAEQVRYRFHGHDIAITGLREAFSHLDPEMDFREAQWNIQPGDIVIDAGASFGSYTIRAAACGGRVYAFEPRTGDCDIIRRIAAQNGLQDRVDVRSVALWDSEGQALMDMGPTMSLVRARCEQVVTTTTIDAFVDREGLDVVDWIKIDTEGAELQILQGAMETLRRFRPTVIVECHLFVAADMDDQVTKLIGSIPGYVTTRHPRPPCMMTVSKRTNE